MGTQLDALCLFAFLTSKCNSSIVFSTTTLLFLSAAFFAALSLLFWLHPGGPAWGKHRLSTSSSAAAATSIPGPRGLPVMGSMGLMTGLAHIKIAAAATSHGATRLMAFSIGSTRAVVSCHPDSAREILNGAAFSNRPVKESAYSLLFHRAIGFAPAGSYWRLLRRVAASHMFSPKQVLSSAPIRASIAADFTSLLSTSSAAFPIRDIIKRASLNNMMWAVFGKKYTIKEQNDDVEELRQMVDQGYELLGGLNWSDHLSWLSPFDLQGTRFSCSLLVPRVNRFVSKIIDQHISNPPLNGVNRDFVDVLLSLPATDRLSESDMIAVLWEMIFRGTDTVAVIIEWILARMVLHPDVQSTVHDELDKVVGRSRVVAESDLPSLPYLTAVIKETFRLHPPGPLLSWARLAVTDTLVDGHLVPAGTTAMVNMYAIARNPEFWPDPLTFKPERFVPGSDSAAALEPDFSIMGSDLRLAPFGSGRRICPGKALGMATVTYWVASLMQEFEWMTSADGATVDLSEVLKLSCEMAHPLKVRARARRSSA
ncbi:hypothetical protein V2J09_013911 [Rumex salicifolius]